MTLAPAPKRRRVLRWAVAAYALALLASHIVTWPSPPSEPATRAAVSAHAATSSGLTSSPARIAYEEWGERGQPAIILVHGTPGSGSNFHAIGPALAERGFWVIAPDLPGFGESSPWPPSYSISAHAYAVQELMDALGIAEAHIVGWSMGGGVVLHMADRLGPRIKTLTLMAAIGAQETEGSGGYWFERAKYLVQYTGLVVMPELVPHFGALGPRQPRHALARNFLDTDQRPLRAIMERLETPTLILHGRHDFLIADWAAERHHQIMPRSTLVMLDAGHFLPFLNIRETVDWLAAHAEGTLASRLPPGSRSLILAPRDAPLGGLGTWLEDAITRIPWWVLLIGLGALWVWRPWLTTAIIGLLIARQRMDFGVGAAALLVAHAGEAKVLFALGRVKGHAAAKLPMISRRVGRISEIDWRRRVERGLWPAAFLWRLQPWERSRAALAAGVVGRIGPASVAATAAGIMVWALLTAICSLMVGTFLTAPVVAGLGWVGLPLSLLLGTWAAWLVDHGVTPTGRARVAAKLSRMARYEFWPSWVLYVPVLAFSAYLAFRYRGFMLMSCCNPAISGGGGIIGESKSQIIAHLSHAGDFVLPCELIPPGGTPQERTLQVKHALESRPELGREGRSFPVVLKPDKAFRGFALKVARSLDDVLEYFQSMHGPAILQRYHPGPRECGVLWMRHPAGPRDGRTGYIYSITRKDFPYVTGDGKRTLEQLIARDARLRCQADTFLHRHADDRSRVLENGERLRLAEAGNHCQGTLFRDGSDLITPALSAVMDQIASGFPSPDGGGLDAGRFDLRYESDERLRRGEAFGIVELNGTAGESTNLYDPGKSLWWAYRVLLGQVARLHELGAARRDAGARPMTLRELARDVRRYNRQRTGSAISD